MPQATKSRTFPVDKSGHTLRGDVAAAYLRAIAAGMPTGGVDVFQRTFAEQQYLYDHQPPRAAYPSVSAPHIDQRALDFHTTTAGKYAPSSAFTWATKGGVGKSNPTKGEKLQINPFGFYRSVPSERWHFEYSRGLDKHRAADLTARLKALGVATVKAFQKAHGLSQDGVDGACTWAALLGAKVPTPAPDPEPEPAGDVGFRAASYNLQAKRFGGGAYSLDTDFTKQVLRPSVLLMQESDETARDAMCQVMGFKVWPHNYLGVLWDPDKYDHADKLPLSFDTKGVQGAVATELTRKENGASFVACSVHIRPNDGIGGTDAQNLAGKKADVAKVIKMLAKYPNVVVGGDWSTEHHRALMLAAGYRQVTPNVDTYKTNKLDAIYVKGTITDRTGGSVHKTPASDHDGLVANLTLPAPIPTN